MPEHNLQPKLLWTPFVLFLGGLVCIAAALLAGKPSAKDSLLSSSVTPVMIAARETPDPALAAAGRTIFLSTCARCHGPKASGIRGLGKPLVGSLFLDGLTDAQFLAFLQVGRPVTDPLNTTGVTMPARGGKAALTDDDLIAVIAYIRSLNGGMSVASG